MISRRNFFRGASTAAGLAALGALPRAAGAGEPASPPPAENPRAAKSPVEKTPAESYPPGEPGRDYIPVITPDGVSLPFRVVNGVKVFHLTAEPVDHEFASGLNVQCWGYNGRVHGPTIEAVEGDRVRIYVTNRLPENTTLHWHGIIVPNGMDGVGGLNQKPIEPGETYRYEFTLRQHGTFMYHAHYDEMTQQALGLMGMFIIHPRHPQGAPPDRDFAIMLSEWRVDVGTRRPNPIEMTDFNLLTMNARVFPGTEPLVARMGERVRIRFGNLSAMDHHPIHVHGVVWKVVATDGGPVPEVAQMPETTVLVSVGQTRTVEFIADNPGDWAMHCHMSHHTMNQMGHQIPNLIGVDPAGLDRKVRGFLTGYMTMGGSGMGEMSEMRMKVPPNSLPMVGAPGKHGYIDMGGMFTVIKIRESVSGYADPGWYENPPGTLAVAATEDELRRDLGSVPGAERAGESQPVQRMPGMGAGGSHHGHGYTGFQGG